MPSRPFHSESPRCPADRPRPKWKKEKRKEGKSRTDTARTTEPQHYNDGHERKRILLHKMTTRFPHTAKRRKMYPVDRRPQANTVKAEIRQRSAAATQRLNRTDGRVGKKLWAARRSIAEPSCAPAAATRHPLPAPSGPPFDLAWPRR